KEDDEAAQEADFRGREAFDRPATVAVVPAEEHGQGGRQGGRDGGGPVPQPRPAAGDDAGETGDDLGQVDEGRGPLAVGMVGSLEDHRYADQRDEERD